LRPEYAERWWTATGLFAQLRRLDGASVDDPRGARLGGAHLRATDFTWGWHRQASSIIFPTRCSVV